MKSTSKRTFYPGDEWLYFKLYTGIKTADDILIRSVFPVVKKLMREEIITKFFLILYHALIKINKKLLNFSRNRVYINFINQLFFRNRLFVLDIFNCFT